MQNSFLTLFLPDQDNFSFASKTGIVNKYFYLFCYTIYSYSIFIHLDYTRFFAKSALLLDKIDEFNNLELLKRVKLRITQLL